MTAPHRFIRFIVLCLLLSGVTTAPAATRDVPMSGPQREQPVRQVVIHATGGPDCNPSRQFRGGTLDGIVTHFLRSQGKISIHYLIGRDGEMVRMVPEAMVAHHVRGQNRDSIGIELINDGDGKDPFPDIQIATLTDLLREILQRYDLAVSDIKGHSALDDTVLTCNGKPIKRKQDPGAVFPWETLQRQLKSPPLIAHPAPPEKHPPRVDTMAQLNRREADARAELKAIAQDLNDARAALGPNPRQLAPPPPVVDLETDAADERRESIEEAINQLSQREAALQSELSTIWAERKTLASGIGVLNN